ncbi:MAG: FeoC-like transcriptional regulator [Anaerolineaceae bacterium]|nr:FeoC-like transcriptional regulator [Anaerolineaceae bacterium]
MKQIMQEFQNTQDMLDLNHISHKLNVEPTALQGMLNYLVQIGKLEKETIGEACNAVCSRRACSGCSLAPSVQAQFRWKLKQ